MQNQDKLPVDCMGTSYKASLDSLAVCTCQNIFHFYLNNYLFSDIMEQMKDKIAKDISNLTARANHSADMASSISRTVGELSGITVFSTEENIINLQRYAEEKYYLIAI